MLYALIGFIGVLVGAACVYVCTPEQICSGCMPQVPESDETEESILKQWQNLLSFTAEAGGDSDGTDS